jgi:glycerol uptake facilitator-like aquaporin
MGERLAGGSDALALLANSLATGAALVTLIVTFGPISGAHLNPLVTAMEAWHGRLPWREFGPYLAAQCGGAVAGVAAANVMFGGAAIAWSGHVRHGGGLFLSEAIATFGLLVVIAIGSSRSPATVPFAVAAYITAAYWFTSSTSFANPAVTIARSLTDTFTGIRPQDVPLFLAAQLFGAAVAAGFARWLLVGIPAVADEAASAED